jgi:hypothetical protein
MGWSRHVKRIADEINEWPSDSDIVVRQKNMDISPAGPKPRMIVLARASRKLPDQRSAYRALVENMKERDFLGHLVQMGE